MAKQSGAAQSSFFTTFYDMQKENAGNHRTFSAQDINEKFLNTTTKFVCNSIDFGRLPTGCTLDFKGATNSGKHSSLQKDNTSLNDVVSRFLDDLQRSRKSQNVKHVKRSHAAKQQSKRHDSTTKFDGLQSANLDNVSNLSRSQEQRTAANDNLAPSRLAP